jgi:hypothetical protein
MRAEWCNVSAIFREGKLYDIKNKPAVRTLRLKCICFERLIFYKPGNAAGFWIKSFSFEN